MTVLPGAEPFSHDGDDVGVLICHGYPGTPQSMRDWAEHLAADGFSVRLPLMHGFGTTWRELNRTRWPQWVESLQQPYQELTQRCRKVFAVGLSMGGLMATKMAQDHPEIAGLVLVNPMFKHNHPLLRVVPTLRFVLPYFSGIAGDIKKPGVTEVALTQNPLQAMHSQTRLWKVVGEALPQLHQPVLIMRSRVDHVIPPISVEYFLEQATNAEVTQLWLENSFHVATLDNDAPLIFERSVDFIRQHS